MTTTRLHFGVAQHLAPRKSGNESAVGFSKPSIFTTSCPLCQQDEPMDTTYYGLAQLLQISDIVMPPKQSQLADEHSLETWLNGTSYHPLLFCIQEASREAIVRIKMFLLRLDEITGSDGTLKAQLWQCNVDDMMRHCVAQFRHCLGISMSSCRVFAFFMFSLLSKYARHGTVGALSTEVPRGSSCMELALLQNSERKFLICSLAVHVSQFWRFKRCGKL